MEETDAKDVLSYAQTASFIGKIGYSDGLFIKPNTKLTFYNCSMSAIFFLVKFFDNQDYANDFVQGKVYADRLSGFKEAESREVSGRIDRYEGVTAWLQPRNGRLQLNGMDLSNDIAGPLTIQMNWLNHLHIFCIHAAYSRNLDLAKLSSDNMEELRHELKISNACSSLGEHAVVVKNVPAFFNLMEVAAKAKGYQFTKGRVRYYNPEAFHGYFRDLESVFWKRDKYSYQREYRFVIDTRTTGDCPLILDIGNIKDITFQMNSNELNGKKFLGGSVHWACGV